MEVRMTKINRFALLLVCTGFFLGFAGCGTQETPSAALWPDGAWALYKQTKLDTDNQRIQGTLKVSSVGKEIVDGEPYYWIELREDTQDGGVTITKFLAKENAQYNPDDSFVFWDDVKRIIIQEGTSTPEEIPSQHLKRFAPSFIESGKARRFGNVKDIDPPDISILSDITMSPGGKSLLCNGKKHERKYISEVNLGFLHLQDISESSTEYYRNASVPFGGVTKVIHSSTTTTANKLKADEPAKPPIHFENSMELEQFGSSGAISQIIGDPVEKQVLPFPFLKGAQTNS
jgi:hypothetical protein